MGEAYVIVSHGLDELVPSATASTTAVLCLVVWDQEMKWGERLYRAS